MSQWSGLIQAKDNVVELPSLILHWYNFINFLVIHLNILQWKKKKKEDDIPGIKFGR